MKILFFSFLFIISCKYSLNRTNPYQIEKEDETKITLTNGDSSISNGVLTLKTSNSHAGAITSLIWNNKNFINNHDFGRQMQVAWAYNDAGECYNPTEAGNSHNQSLSRFLSGEISSYTIKTISNPSFWLLPGDSSTRTCG